MKKLILLFLLASLSIFGCKKDNSTTQAIEVHYNFNMNGVPSDISYTSISNNKSIALNNVTTAEITAGVYKAYSVTDFVKPGDQVHLEMNTTTKVVGYIIYITYIKHLANGDTIDPVIASKIVSGSSVMLDKTFTTDDFK